MFKERKKDRAALTQDSLLGEPEEALFLLRRAHDFDTLSVPKFALEALGVLPERTWANILGFQKDEIITAERLDWRILELIGEGGVLDANRANSAYERDFIQRKRTLVQQASANARYALEQKVKA